MTHHRFYFKIITLLSLVLPHAANCQSWDFIKEKDGIKLYTRTETGKIIKTFKGVTDISVPAEKIFDVLRDINNTDWWDKNVSLNKVLDYEKTKGGRYYLVYNLPWPVPDRDLCVDVKVLGSQVPGERRISAVSVNGIIPEQNGLVRIRDYKQAWIVRPVSKNITHVELEGHVDPAGMIPDWIINMLITESPYKSIDGLRKQVMPAD